MSLADLIKKRETRKDAHAISAKTANDDRLATPQLAKIATLALAGPAEELVSTSASTEDVAPTSEWWRFHYADGKPKEATYFPAVSHPEALMGESGAILAEPFQPRPRHPAEPLSEKEEASIRALLAAIGEEDEAMIIMALEQCRTDQDARDAYLDMAKQHIRRSAN